MNLILCNTEFDRENDNVLLFDSKQELNAYFDNLSDKVEINDVNFDVNDGITTSIYVKVDNTLSLFKLLNYNYCVVKQSAENYLYYFIIDSKQDAGNQIKIDLQLDVFNSYLPDIIANNNDLQALINKTHINRFIETSTNNFIYNFDETSPLFERETIKDVSKRVTKQDKLKIIIDTTNKDSMFNNWINDNIACWCYVYLSSNVKYKVRNFEDKDLIYEQYLDELHYTDSIELNTFTPETNSINSNFNVISVPIYKQNAKHMYILDTNERIELRLKAIYDFLSENNNFANVQSIKFSIMPPICVGSYSNLDYQIEDNGELTLKWYMTQDNVPTFRNSTYWYVTYNQSHSTVNWYSCYFLVFKQYMNRKVKMITNINENWTFDKNYIKSNYLEPKLYNEDYSLYRLIIGGQQYDIPISKTSNTPEFIYYETLTPDITKALLVYDNEANKFENNIFSEYNTKDFTGFTFTIDLSMWYPSNQLNNYLANNKNYLQIFQNQQASKLVKSFNTAAAGIGTSVATGNALAGVATGVNLLNTLIGTAFEKSQFDMTIDNMKNSPEQTSNINSDIILIQSISGIDILIEKLEPLTFEKEIIKDNLKIFGYTYNKLGNVKDFIKTRKYFNYIQAIVFEIDAPLSERVKDLIKNLFLKGVRIWHAKENKKVNFNLNNYERFLDNEQ